jgi:hypothetical protein
MSELDPDMAETLKKFLNDFDNNQILHDRSHADVFQDSESKIIACPHEIVFTITAKVLEENQKGELISNKEIYTKNYHIPVPIDQDYNMFMETFFRFLEECLSTSANEAHSDKEKNHG